MPAPNYRAGGNIRPSRFVKSDVTDDNQVLEADANEPVVGISQEGGREPPLPSVSTIYAGQDGDSMQVYSATDECLLVYGDTVTRGDLLKSDADGCGVPVATTGTTQQFYGARALSSGAAGDVRRVQVVIGSIYPALA